ncbi:MAG: hypothetical protein HFE66_07680 [Clostridiales bacterium]|jgi:hypothetical protein|nr:hypothetical protein [Clostridiales bacterium]
MKSHAIFQRKTALGKKPSCVGNKARKPCCINILPYADNSCKRFFAGIIKLKGIILINHERKESIY